MGFSDRLRAWLKGESKRASSSPQMRESSKEATEELERFARSRAGVEAFLEPKTTLYSTTVLLVADDGEYLRRPVNDRGQAASLCDDLNIPLYDARKVGYPQRMRDYDQGRAPRRIELSELPPWPGDESAGPADGPPPPPVPPVEDPSGEHPHLDAGPEDPAPTEGGDGDGEAPATHEETAEGGIADGGAEGRADGGAGDDDLAGPDDDPTDGGR